MAKINLTGGAYVARSILANASVCRNLYLEFNGRVSQPSAAVTHYPTPGLVHRVTPQSGAVRGLYRATNGALYGVIGDKVYVFATDWTVTEMGTIPPGSDAVSMKDNGQVVVLVDGSDRGWWWALGTDFITEIVDGAFYGAQRVCYLDGYFVFNRPQTNQFYLSPYYWDGVAPFDPLYIAEKTGGPDRVISISVIRGQLWLLGALTSEVWYNSGGADFPFERLPGVFIDHGMVAGWTVDETDVSVAWLARDVKGQGIVVMSREYQAVRVSNHAIEFAIQSYDTINDAIGFFYQQDGHTFFVLTFPTADKTWVYDLAASEAAGEPIWHERTWTDPATSVEHRIRPMACAFAFNQQVVGDHSNGKVYTWDLDVGTDDGDPISRRRSFPHLLNDGKRVEYQSFIAWMQTGTASGVLQGTPDIDVMLRYSDTGGASWSDNLPLRWGASGQYDISLIWRRLGLGRDRIFELFWDHPYKTALNGAWIEAEGADD